MVNNEFELLLATTIRLYSMSKWGQVFLVGYVSEKLTQMRKLNG